MQRLKLCRFELYLFLFIFFLSNLIGKDTAMYIISKNETIDAPRAKLNHPPTFAEKKIQALMI